jgi:hypothetical protein
VGCPRACCARPERRRTAAEECGLDARNWALGVAEQDVGVEAVLLRVREKELRRRGGLSTATRRWRPEEARGRRGACARGQEGMEGKSSKRWRSGACAGGQRRRQSGAGEGSGGARGRRSRQESEGLVRDFQIVWGPLGKLKFLTATKVK